MNREDYFYISYSARHTYLTCPKKYRFIYVLKAPRSKDISSSIVGSTVGILFQWFYQRDLWKLANVRCAMESMIPDAIREAFRNSKTEIDTDLALRTEPEIPKYIANGLEIIRSNRLLRQENLAEVDLTICKNKTETHPVIKLGGRADFILRDPSEAIILDGKASAQRDKYTDPEQLIWYALQYYLKFRKAPDRIGFLFWGFPENPMKWIEYTDEDLRNSYRKTLTVVSDISAGKFAPNLSSNCKICDYRPQCPEGNQFILDMDFKANQNIIESSVFDVDIF